MKMSLIELLLCIVAVVASSTSQLFIKSVASQGISLKSLYVFGVAGILMLFSIIIAVWVLRTIQLSQLLPFAALAYVLVPLGGNMFFNEYLQPRFWAGVILIVFGVICASV